MKQPIAMQSFSRSRLDKGRLLSFDQEVVRFPTQPLIHADARLLLVRSGSGTLSLQGQTYPLQAGCLAAILPWQISELTEVREPLQYDLIAYHLDTVCRAARLFSDPEGKTLPLQARMEAMPAAQLSQEAFQRAKEISGALRKELGLESAPRPEPAGEFSNTLALSLLIELLVLLLRTEAEALPQERVPDERALLRYIYLHCNEKLTLQTLADTFYLSRASISARLSAMTGLSFFDLLNEMRIGKTANYLLYTDLTLKEMAEFLGYVDESHISKVFAARLGTRIGEYRATYQRVENICRVEESRLGYTLVNYIYRNYASPLSAREVARQFGVSVAQLHETLLYQTERNFEDFLNLIRVNRACELLLSTRLSVLEIAAEVGFHNAKTLTRNFLKFRRQTPGAYRAALSGASR